MAKVKKAGMPKLVILQEEQQPFKLPKNWIWTNIESINNYNGASVDPMKSPGSEYELYSVPSSAENYPEIVSGSEIGSTKQSVEMGDVLLCKINPRINRVWKVSQHTDNELLASSEWIVIRNAQMNPDYLMYCFRTQYFRAFMLSNVSGVGGSLMRAQPKYVKNYPVPVAPILEQKRIVDRIESLFAKLDEAKEKAQAVVDGYEDRRAAILHKAFSGELTSQWRKENGVRMENWDKLTLDDVAEYKKGPFGSSITKAMFVPKGDNTYKVYEQGNAIRKTLQYGHYYISKEKYNELKGFAVAPGDILISCAGTIGEIYKLPDTCEPGVINQALMRVRIKENIDESYFIYYFSGVLKGDVVDKANGTAIKNIPPFKIMKAMEIKLPSMAEQQYIVSTLDRLLDEECHAKEAAEAVVEQIDIIKKSILAKAFRGELGTNDPTEESAAELLKTIV